MKDRIKGRGGPKGWNGSRDGGSQRGSLVGSRGVSPRGEERDNFDSAVDRSTFLPLSISLLSFFHEDRGCLENV